MELPQYNTQHTPHKIRSRNFVIVGGRRLEATSLQLQQN
jgi:hypothetical protein